MGTDAQNYVAFSGTRLMATGGLPTVLRRIHDAARSDTASEAAQRVLIFEEATGRQVDFDLRGSLEEVLGRVTPAPRPGPGRPKLGVVAREISLLPRHWEWLEQQPNGASAALRRLVDEARHRDPEKQQARQAAEATHRFMTAMAGDLPGYEEAMRALYATDRESFEARTAGWPADVLRQIRRMTAEVY